MVDRLLCFVFALNITAPFINEAFERLFGIGIYYILILTMMLLLFMRLIKINTVRKINSIFDVGFAIFLVIVLFSYLISILIGYVDKRHLLNVILITCGIWLGVIFKSVQLNIKYFSRYISILSLLGIIIGLGSFKKLLLGYTTASRMIYNSNPLSIAVLSGFLVISLLNNRQSYIKTMALFAVAVIIMTLSRGPLISLVFVYILKFTFDKKVKFVFILFFVGMVAFYFITQNRISIDITNGRMQIYKDSLALFFKNTYLINGLGVGALERMSGYIKFSHNLLIDVLVSFGIFSEMLLVVTIFVVMKNFKVSIQAKRNTYIYMLLFYLFFALQFSFNSIQLLRIFIPITIVSLKKNEENISCLS